MNSLDWLMAVLLLLLGGVIVLSTNTDQHDPQSEHFPDNYYERAQAPFDVVCFDLYNTRVAHHNITRAYISDDGFWKMVNKDGEVVTYLQQHGETCLKQDKEVVK